MVEVIAPSDMAEGFTFDASYNGVTFPVVVPEGGVKAGEKLSVPFKSDSTATATASNVVTGKWKDDLCSCCSRGLCHPSLCCAWWCGICSLAQVMTRMELDWCGKPAPESAWRNTFRTILILSIVIYVVLSVLGGVANALYPPNEEGVQENNPISAAQNLVNLAYFIYIMVIMVRTRGHVREKYGIEGSCLGDCCCGYWCSCCVLSQMARQTHDYDAEPVECCSGACCTPTGTP